MAAKETKNNTIIKQKSKVALNEKNGITCTFWKKNTLLFVCFICLLFKLEMCQIILPDPVLGKKNGSH